MFSITFTRDLIIIPCSPLPDHEIGAKVEFHGIVRANEKGEILSGLTYEAYEPMAHKQLERIFNELLAAHPCDLITFIHRLGWVPTGEVSLYLCCLSAHRAEAFAFCSQAIDRMKQDVPIWKKI